jgi:hypothetical protein
MRSLAMMSVVVMMSSSAFANDWKTADEAKEAMSKLDRMAGASSTMSASFAKNRWREAETEDQTVTRDRSASGLSARLHSFAAGAETTRSIHVDGKTGLGKATIRGAERKTALTVRSEGDSTVSHINRGARGMEGQRITTKALRFEQAIPTSELSKLEGATGELKALEGAKALTLIRSAVRRPGSNRIEYGVKIGDSQHGISAKSYRALKARVSR